MKKTTVVFTEQEMKLLEGADDDMELALIGWLLAKKGIDASAFKDGWSFDRKTHTLSFGGK